MGKTRSPRTGALGRVVLCSSTIERVWSMYGTTITPSRSRLLPKRATEMLVTKWNSVARANMKAIAAKQAEIEVWLQECCAREPTSLACVRSRASPPSLELSPRSLPGSMWRMRWVAVQAAAPPHTLALRPAKSHQEAPQLTQVTS